MNLLIFGATGATGSELVKQALAQGHRVRAFVRNPDKVDMADPNLKLVKGDITDAAAVEEAVQGQDAVLSALGSSSLKKNPGLTEGIRTIVQAMEKHSGQRLIYESSLGVGDSRERINFVFRSIIIPLVLRNAIADHESKEQIIKQSSLDWVIVRPAGLTNGAYTGQYRHGDTIQYGANISRADVADFMLKQVSNSVYLHKTPGVSY